MGLELGSGGRAVAALGGQCGTGHPGGTMPALSKRRWGGAGTSPGGAAKKANTGCRPRCELGGRAKKGHFLSQHNSSLSVAARSRVPAPPAEEKFPKISLPRGVMVFGFLSRGKIPPYPHPSIPASFQPASNETRDILPQISPAAAKKRHGSAGAKRGPFPAPMNGMFGNQLQFLSGILREPQEQQEGWAWVGVLFQTSLTSFILKVGKGKR